VTRINSAGGPLIFQSTSGTATYTENAGTPNVAGAGRFLINQPTIKLMSNLDVTQDNQPDLNTSTEFAGRIDGGSGITFTKYGVANLQLSNDTTNLFAGEGFEGQFIINNGAIRLIGREPLLKASGVTVNAGGQLQLAENNANQINTWNMASGSIIINGNGKASGNASDGALRFGLSTVVAGRSTTLNAPVVLQSDSRINVGAAGTFATIASVVSGPGDLISMSSNNTGTLILTNAANSYTGDTHVLSGTLSITNPYLFNDADVYLSDLDNGAVNAFFNLSFPGEDEIRSLFIDGVAQTPGKYGAVGTPGIDFSSPLITGTGILNVTELPAPTGTPGDFNDDGMVDAADYVLWRKLEGTASTLNGNGDETGGSANNVDAADYALWQQTFGNAAGGAGGAEGVPEPGSLLLIGLGVAAMLISNRRKYINR
jgi:autotransporter-associated beta strand protein